MRKGFEKKLYYKLCCDSPGQKLLSYCPPDHSFNLYYELDKVTKPIPGSIGILVFDTLYNARQFCAAGWFFKCLVRGPVLKVDKVASYGYAYADDCRGQIKLNRKRRLKQLEQLVFGIRQAPTGTFSVAAAKLVETVGGWD